jgi:hypothetical protein
MTLPLTLPLANQWEVQALKNPPDVPPCPRGDAIFIERGVAKRHEKLP